MYIYMNVYMTKESKYSELLLNKYNVFLVICIYIELKICIIELKNEARNSNKQLHEIFL